MLHVSIFTETSFSPCYGTKGETEKKTSEHIQLQCFYLSFSRPSLCSQKTQDNEKSNRIFPKRAHKFLYKLTKLQFISFINFLITVLLGNTWTVPPSIPEKQKENRHQLILYRFMYTETLCKVESSNTNIRHCY